MRAIFRLPPLIFWQPRTCLSWILAGFCSIAHYCSADIDRWRIEHAGKHKLIHLPQKFMV